MSTVYNLEPQPTASAIIHTTQGEISVELFAKQIPLASRNFLQLSLDGYYDDTIFHRLVPGFILQGGDPTGTGQGGECIYDGGAFGGDLDPWPMDQRKGKNAGMQGVNFKDEFHSRLKFNRRGLLGVANEGEPNTNGSQFFFTLGKAEELNGKNTLFGRVAGDTIYNLMKMGEADVEEGGERPQYPVKITRVEILINPFKDMEKRERRVRSEPAAKTEKKLKKRKGGKQLLSFGHEEGEEDVVLVTKRAKYDTRILVDVEEESSLSKKTTEVSAKKKKQKVSSKDADGEDKGHSKLCRAPDLPDPALKELRQANRDVSAEESRSVDSSPEPQFPRKTPLEQTNAEIAAVKASMKRTVARVEPAMAKQKTTFEQLIPKTSVRGRRAKPGAGQTLTKDDQEALNLLNAFRSKLEQAPVKESHEPALAASAMDRAVAGDGEGATDDVCELHFIANCQSCQAWDKRESKDDSDDEDWMSHALNCAADKLGKDLSYRKKAEEELVVIDPLAKAQTLKEEKRTAKGSRSGVSRRAWDEKR